MLLIVVYIQVSFDPLPFAGIVKDNLVCLIILPCHISRMRILSCSVTT